MENQLSEKRYDIIPNDIQVEEISSETTVQADVKEEIGFHGHQAILTPSSLWTTLDLQSANRDDCFTVTDETGNISGIALGSVAGQVEIKLDAASPSGFIWDQARRLKDRLKKQEQRRNPAFREKEKELARCRMKWLRQDTNYREHERQKDRERKKKIRLKLQTLQGNIQPRKTSGRICIRHAALTQPSLVEIAGMGC